VFEQVLLEDWLKYGNQGRPPPERKKETLFDKIEAAKAAVDTQQSTAEGPPIP